MIGHVAEVWIALFAAFAVGSVIGWLVFRWVDRSDYAFDQRELSDAVSRRLRRDKTPAREPQPVRPQLALPPAADFIALPPPRSETADRFRSRVRSSSLAAAWRASRSDDEAPSVADAPPAPAKPPPEAPRVQRPPPAPQRATSRRDSASAAGGDEPWPAAAGAWPLPAVPAAPKDAAGGNGADKSAASPPLVGPSHLYGVAAPDDIWSEGGSRPAEPPGEIAKKAAGKRPAGLAAAPAQADDLQQIRGIGPTFAKKLNELGIYRYHQIAAWTAAERDWISADLGAQRIEKDEWIEQAAALAKPPVKAEDPPPA